MFKIILKKNREEKGLSQRGLAEKFNLSQGTVGNWESGVREPNFQTLIQLADFFNISVDSLLGHESISPDSYLLTEAEALLIKNFRSLNRQGQEYILQTMDMAKDKYKKATELSDVENSVG